MPIIENVDDDWMASTLWVRDVSQRRHATLTLRVRMRLNLMPAEALQYRDFQGNPVTVQTIDWDDGRAEIWFKEALKRVVEGGWSGRYWLLPDSDWAASQTVQNGAERIAPAISLRLQLDLDFGARHPHCVVNAYRMQRNAQGEPTGDFRSYMHSPNTLTGNARECAWRQNQSIGLLTTHDVYPRTNGFVVAIHEFGHYIGLSHVNAAGARAQGADPNGRMAYGVGAQRNDVMGAGATYDFWHTYPWCQRLRRHLPQPGVSFSTEDWHTRSPITWQTAPGWAAPKPDYARGDTPVTWTVCMNRPQPQTTMVRPVEVSTGAN